MGSMEEKQCWICSSTKYVDEHHIDKEHGKRSPETVPLCRRCHRTYHDLGVDYFDDDLVDKAIDLENLYRSLPIHTRAPMKREQIVRSPYWLKQHGVLRSLPDHLYKLMRPGIRIPLCGWDWVEEHQDDEYPEPCLTIMRDGQVIAEISLNTKHRVKTIKALIREYS